MDLSLLLQVDSVEPEKKYMELSSKDATEPEQLSSNVTSPSSSAAGYTTEDTEYERSTESIAAPTGGQKAPIAPKPFFCPRCLTGFSTKGNLNVHQRTVHLREYNFKCDACLRHFNTNASLKRHLKMVHYGERPHACPLCANKFATRACVKRHCERRHPQHAAALRARQPLSSLLTN